MAPAFRASRVAPHEALKEQGRSGSADRRFSLGNMLVVSQVGLSLVLMVAAGLFMRTFSSLARLDPGFQQDPVLIVSANAQRLGLEPKDRPQLFERMRESVTSVPGVDAVAVSAVTPSRRWDVAVPDRDTGRAADARARTFGPREPPLTVVLQSARHPHDRRT